MSNRRRLHHQYETRACEDCGELLRLDLTKYAVAIHDCETGEWFAMPREIERVIDRAVR